MKQALALWEVIFTMSALCGLETSSLYYGEANTSFRHFRYSLYTIMLFWCLEMWKEYTEYTFLSATFFDTEMFVAHMPL